MCVYLCALLAIHKLFYSAELQLPYTALLSITVPEPDSAQQLEDSSSSV